MRNSERTPTPFDDSPFEIGPGLVVRSFSVEHLTCQNLFAKASPEVLRERLETTAGAYDPLLEPGLRNLFRDAASALSHDNHPDADLVFGLIAEGHLAGLAAAWGVSPEADLMWASAARLLEKAGVRHPNELLAPAPEQVRSALSRDR